MDKRLQQLPMHCSTDVCQILIPHQQAAFIAELYSVDPVTHY